MNRAKRQLTPVVLLLIMLAGSARAQFDLMTVHASDRIAASKYFVVANDQVSTFDPSNLSRPIAVTSSGSMLVARIQGATSVAVPAAVPEHFELSQNFPNPFNMSTKIVYSIPSQSRVTLNVYDILGRTIASLVNGQVEAGSHTVDFAKNDITSGTYFYRLTAVNSSGAVSVEMKKMILMK